MAPHPTVQLGFVVRDYGASTTTDTLRIKTALDQNWECEVLASASTFNQVQIISDVVAKTGEYVNLVPPDAFNTLTTTRGVGGITCVIDGERAFWSDAAASPSTPIITIEVY